MSIKYMPVRCTLEAHTYKVRAIRYTPMRCIPMRYTPMIHMSMNYVPMRGTSVRCTPHETHDYEMHVSGAYP
jgi:hypothetical protein